MSENPVSKEVCDAKHEAIHVELKGIRQTQGHQRELLEKIDTALCGDGVVGGKPGMVAVVENNRKWNKRILVVLGAIVIAAVTTLTTLLVTYLWEGKADEVSQPVSGSVLVDPAN